MNLNFTEFFKHLPFLSESTTGIVMDVVILIIFAIIVKRSYDKGALPVVFEILAVILSVVGAFVLAAPAAAYITTLGESYPYIAQYVVPLTHTIWMVIILYFVISIILKIIELIVIHFAEDTIERFKPTKLLSKLIAIAIGAVKGLLLISLIVTVLLTAMFGDVSGAIKESYVTTHLVDAGNKTVEMAVGLNDRFNIISKENIKFASQGVLESSLTTLINGYKNGLISEKVAVEALEKYYLEAIYEVMPMMDAKEKKVLDKLIDKTSLTKSQKKDLKQHIIERS